METKRKIFITGIAGFIGFHLASSLAKNGEYVIGCDNFNDYYPPQLKRMRADQLKSLKVEVLSLDIQKIQSITPLLQTKGITHVVHLAAQAGVRYSITHPMPYADSNLSGFLSVLELSRFLEAKFIFASSSSVYGGNTKLPFSETDPTDSPLSLYAATKKSGELLAKSYHHLYQIPMTGLRFFTVYGPWGRPDMAYFSFAKKILEGKPIPVFNQGKMERDFTYIDDIIAGTLSAIERCNGFEIYNLGNHHVEPLMHLITLLESALGKKAIIAYQPMQAGDVQTTYADISKAQKNLGFSPQISLASGISLFADWLLKNHPQGLE